MLLLRLATWTCGIVAFTGRRWAYLTYIVLGLLYFPASVGFRVHPRACQVDVSGSLLLFSLRNTPHIVLFAIFFVMTAVQLRATTPASFARAGAVTLIVGALVELAEGVSGSHNCRVRDLVPDAAGAVLGFMLVVAWIRVIPPREPHGRAIAR